MKCRMLTTMFLTLFTCLLMAQTENVDMLDFEFSPADITIAEGTTVLWTNKSASIHTSTSGTDCTNNGTWDSGNVAPGGDFSMTFENGTEGVYPYYCIPHCAQGMTGTVTVEATSANEDIANPIAASVYPNPFTNRLAIEADFDTPGELKILIYNTAGSVVFQREEGSPEMSLWRKNLDTNFLGVGTYFLTIEQNGRKLVNAKVVKLQ